MNKKNIRDINLDEINHYIVTKGEHQYRGQQIFDWLWKHHALTFEDMNNVPKKLRDHLKEDFILTPLVIDETQTSKDETIKLKLKTHDGYFIESVLIPHKDRLTGCISSQVGCSLDCSFCATGTMKLQRQLQHDEIFDQVLFLNAICQSKYQKKMTNIVFMGMGEPLLNYAQVKKAIENMTSPKVFAMSPSRITISTSGISKMIKKLADDNTKCELALSLHAPNNLLRNKLMSINKSNHIEDLIESLEYYYQKTKQKITLEYVLLKKVNDSSEDALSLAAIYKKSPAILVNIIEYNRTGIVGFEKATKESLENFVTILAQKRVNVRVRRSRGEDIHAACGQLANKKVE